MTENTTAQPAVKRLERSRSDRMLAGVGGGLARYFELNPAFFRVGFVVLTLLGGAGLLIYLAAALVIPEEGKADSIAAEALRERREKPWQLIGLGLVAVAAAVLLSRATLWPRGDAAWILVLLAGAVVLWTQRRASGARPRVLRGLAIAAVVVVVLALAAAAAVATAFHVNVGNGIGTRTYVRDLPPRGVMGVLSLELCGIGDSALPDDGERQGRRGPFQKQLIAAVVIAVEEDQRAEQFPVGDNAGELDGPVADNADTVGGIGVSLQRGERARES